MKKKIKMYLEYRRRLLKLKLEIRYGSIVSQEQAMKHLRSAMIDLIHNS